MKLRAIEIVEDRTAQSRCDQGFLTLARLRLRNVYEDGSRSEPYACDVVSRPGSDAVVAVLYELDGARRVRVLLREAPRPAIYLRSLKRFVHPDPGVYRSLRELVAGLVEASDGAGDLGLCRRAAQEAYEEAGLALAPPAFRVIGDALFASPGTSDEKVFFCAGRAALDQAQLPPGDGSVMEQGGELVALELGEAIEACRRGEIPDMKTEVGLLRLADHLGYLPQLGCFVDELPAELAARHRRLGVAAAPSAGAPRPGDR
jgi:ADP-ribose pyrophosphatase